MNTKNKTKSKQNQKPKKDLDQSQQNDDLKKMKENGLPAVVIEKAIETGDFSSLTDNKFLKVDSPQIKSLLLNVFDNIKRQNPGLKLFDFTILILFSSVVEIWDLTQDRDRYSKFEKDLLPRKLSIVEKELLRAREHRNTKKELLYIHESVNIGLVARATKTEAEIDSKTLNDYIYYLKSIDNMKNDILKSEQLIAKIKTNRDSLKVSIELKHYNVSKDGNIYTTMQTNLIGKYERLTKLMEQYNITPKTLNLSSEGILENKKTSTTNFSAFSNFKSDKKVKEEH